MRVDSGKWKVESGKQKIETVVSDQEEIKQKVRLHECLIMYNESLSLLYWLQNVVCLHCAELVLICEDF